MYNESLLQCGENGRMFPRMEAAGWSSFLACSPAPLTTPGEALWYHTAKSENPVPCGRRTSLKACGIIRLCGLCFLDQSADHFLGPSPEVPRSGEVTKRSQGAFIREDNLRVL